MRIALFTLESLASSEAVLRFVARDPSRIVLLGHSTPDRMAQLRRRLAQSGPRILPYLAVNFSVVGAWRRRGRLADLCRAHAIPALPIRDVNQTHAAIHAARPDLILTFHFDQILQPETLALAPLGGINVHPSLLPRHRGPIPTFHALAEGGTGVSVHVLAPRIDAGGILVQQAVTLPPDCSVGSAARLLHLAALPLVEAALAMLPASPSPPPLLPYRPFPDAATLRRSAVPLVRSADWRAALFAPAGGW